VIAGLVVLVIAMLLVDLLLFARGRQPTFRESVWWSIGWLVFGVLVAIPMWLIDDTDGAVNYVTVYLIERSLSLDNLFVFLLIFGYFAVPQQHRGRLLFYGIVLALIMRGAAILVGVELIERFHFVIYILGVTLLYLAWKILNGAAEDVDPNSSLFVRLVRRVMPVTDRYHGGKFVVRDPAAGTGGRRARVSATPLLLATVSIVAADIAFAVDSIPAAFAITTDSFAIWAANAFALMGLRALFALVEELIKRFRYLDETIAVVLAVVAIKLLIEDIVKIGPVVSLAIVIVAFVVGITASLLADKRDPEGARERMAEHERRAEADRGAVAEADRGAVADADRGAVADADRGAVAEADRGAGAEHDVT
jgi:tellurite resistance protein TerC